jgi:hypothetical protein
MLLHLLAVCFIFVIFSFFNVFAERREFPDTRDGIFIFYDQLPGGLTQAQLKFVAEHYIGCQKIPLDVVNSIRNYNNDFIVINYRLAFGTYDAIPAYIVGNEWINDWDSVKIHDDWFVTDPQSSNPKNRIRQNDWNWFLMDISGEINGNTTNGWKEYWVRTVLGQLRETNCDGVFADSYGIPWNLDFTPDWLMPPDDTEWIRHMNIFGMYVRNQFAAQPEKFYFIANLGPWVTTRDTCDYGVFLDGVMIEFFASWGAWDLFEIEDWKLQMNRILDIERRGKAVICQPITEDEWAVGERMYNLANYLLIKGEKTFYNLVFSENFYERLVFFPEYLVDLGSYTDDLPLDIDAFYDDDLGLYTREYEKGRVLVNPTWDSIKVPLDKEYLVVDTDDLFDDPLIDIGEDGVFRDSLAFRKISDSLTVDYKGGVILLDPGSTGICESDRSDIEVKQFITANNFPDPFNMGTHFQFVLPAAEGKFKGSLQIFDIKGRMVRHIHMENLQQGLNRTEWDSRDMNGLQVPSGIYLYRILINHDQQSVFMGCGKMCLVR